MTRGATITKKACMNHQAQTEIEIQHDAEQAVERFNVHRVDDAPTLNWMALMRRTYAEAAREICLRLPPSRERSVALTKLEEAMFWTSAAAARANGVPNGFGTPSIDKAV